MVDAYDSRIIGIADHYGFEGQSRQLVEEMAELTVAVNKFWRNVLKCGKVEYSEDPAFRKMAMRSMEMKNIMEEIADVEISLAQLRYLIGLEALINANIEMKVSRQVSRVLTERLSEGE